MVMHAGEVLLLARDFLIALTVSLPSFHSVCLFLSLPTRKTEPLSDSGKSLLEFSILCSLPSLRAPGQHGGGFESGARRGRMLWSNRHLFKPTTEDCKKQSSSFLPLANSLSTDQKVRCDVLLRLTGDLI